MLKGYPKPHKHPAFAFEEKPKPTRSKPAIENDSYIILEPINGPKYRKHTRRLGSYKILSSNKNDYRLQNLISKREFSTRIIKTVPSRFNP